MKSWRRHRWISLLALFGLLFQQAAMAAYVCPMEQRGGPGVEAIANQPPPCHTPGAADQVRCNEHCSPTASAVGTKPTPDAALPPLAVPAWPRLNEISAVPRISLRGLEALPPDAAVAVIVRFCRRLD